MRRGASRGRWWGSWWHGGALLAAVLAVGCGKDFTELRGQVSEPPPGESPESEMGTLDAGIADAGDAGGRDGGLPDAEVPVAVEVPFVLPQGITQLPAKLELAGDWRLVEAFPGIRFDDPVALIAVPRTNQFIVSEREGKVYAFENRPDVTEKRLVLDLSGQNQGENDSGLLGIVCHPEFALPGSSNAQYLYVHYAFRPSPIVGRTPSASTSTNSRLSRFTVDLQTLVADPASELVLIDQQDQSIWHQGGALMFHPGDGFLYLTVGDEGGSRCQYGNCQRIDKDLFSGVLRIDVDQKGGNVSHPIPRQPETGATQGYFIPNDNPFVGQAGVLEEFYALGLRNTYRMTYDPVDDLVWMGEVGQESREEIDVLAPGANYQWNVFEGTLSAFGAMPETPLGIWTDPVLDFDRRQLLTIIGGYVYRGQRFPALQGKYVFADWSRGNIFALPYVRTGGQLQLGELEFLMTAEFRNRDNGITSFGVDEAGELYVLALGADSKIQRFEFGGTLLNAPRQLSEVGVFRDLATLAPAESLAAYSVQSPLWSDGAQKQRWLALPEHQQVDFAPVGPWQFPEGTVFVKHFALALDERQPDVLTRLETRLLVSGAEQAFYGLTYKWNAEGSDAELVTDPLTETLAVIDADGNARPQSYFYPGPRDCLVCHNAPAGRVLGVRTAQLNGPLAGDETAPNQLQSWAERGWFRSNPELGALAEYAQLAPLGDEARSLEDRVRSYWDGNCSMCHGVQTSIRANWDARYQTPLAQQGLILADSLNGGSDGAVHLIEPGAAELSILYQRNATLASDQRMPPLGTNRRDEAYLELLERWITSLGPGAPQALDAGAPDAGAP